MTYILLSTFAAVCKCKFARVRVGANTLCTVNCTEFLLFTHVMHRRGWHSEREQNKSNFFWHALQFFLLFVRLHRRNGYERGKNSLQKRLRHHPMSNDLHTAFFNGLANGALQLADFVHVFETICIYLFCS